MGLDEIRRLKRGLAPSDWQRWQEVILKTVLIPPSKPVQDAQLADLLPIRQFPTVYVAGSGIVDPWLDQMGADLDEGCAVVAGGGAEAVRADSAVRSTLIS